MFISFRDLEKRIASMTDAEKDMTAKGVFQDQVINLRSLHHEDESGLGSDTLVLDFDFNPEFETEDLSELNDFNEV